MRGSLHGFAWFQALELWVSGFGTDGFRLWNRWFQTLKLTVSSTETKGFTQINSLAPLYI